MALDREGYARALLDWSAGGCSEMVPDEEDFVNDWDRARAEMPTQDEQMEDADPNRDHDEYEPVTTAVEIETGDLDHEDFLTPEEAES